MRAVLSTTAKERRMGLWGPNLHLWTIDYCWEGGHTGFSCVSSDEPLKLQQMDLNSQFSRWPWLIFVGHKTKGIDMNWKEVGGEWGGKITMVWRWEMRVDIAQVIHMCNCKEKQQLKRSTITIRLLHSTYRTLLIKLWNMPLYYFVDMYNGNILNNELNFNLISHSWP